ncbi:MAG: hypothetical protein QN191_02195 [Armatimonadota bacterium]|nr:hypothetical protein [Armatimonadota bacterium]MDR5689191.1 hypothetical protein [Armatimonadota bacterium]MDR7391549.1 hypothetical protein [Armatimonadota bacterium]MDR7598745.1 hypothetical protein [Armatimonadota bacterium]MDR7608135.1 hypothetical protein [Armatimonadota bacterium]
MADVVRRVEYQYVVVPDRPGEGLRVLAALQRAGVNLLAYLGFPVEGGRAQLDLVAENPDALRRVAAQEGWQLSAPKQAFLVQGDDRVGAAGEHIRKLSEAGINITAAAATAAGAGRYGMILWVRAEDYERAAQILGA